MDFYEFKLFTSVMKRKIKDFNVHYKNEAAFYAAMIQQIDGQSSMSKESQFAFVNQCLTEMAWIIEGKPYYKIYGELINPFCKTSLKFPAKFIKFPFKSFLIRLPKTNNPLMVDESHVVQTILLEKRVNDEGETRLFIWVDFGELDAESDLVPVLTWKQIIYHKNDERTVEDVFDTLPLGESASWGIQISEDMLKKCFRLAISVGFIATSESVVVEPDILKQDMARLKSPVELQHYHERAIKRGKFGWTIGRTGLFTSSPSSTSDNDELSYAHWRNGHFHLYWTGEGRKIGVIKWVNPLVVRSDLPFKKGK